MFVLPGQDYKTTAVVRDSKHILQETGSLKHFWLEFCSIHGKNTVFYAVAFDSEERREDARTVARKLPTFGSSTGTLLSKVRFFRLRFGPVFPRT